MPVFRDASHPPPLTAKGGQDDANGETNTDYSSLFPPFSAGEAAPSTSMDLEEERDVVGLGLTNGQGSVDPQAHGLDPSTDSSAVKGHFAANGYHSSAPARQAALTEQAGEEKPHAKTNGRASKTAGKGEGGHAEEDLWASILNSVKSSRAVPVKNIIMLGE